MHDNSTLSIQILIFYHWFYTIEHQLIKPMKKRWNNMNRNIGCWDSIMSGSCPSRRRWGSDWGGGGGGGWGRISRMRSWGMCSRQKNWWRRGGGRRRKWGGFSKSRRGSDRRILFPFMTFICCCYNWWVTMWWRSMRKRRWRRLQYCYSRSVIFSPLNSQRTFFCTHNRILR